jgi:photoactive yellow protein
MPTEISTRVSISFEAPLLQAELDAMRGNPSLYDALEFGLIVMDLDGAVIAYNACESAFAGIPAERVLGLVFFTDIAPCTNNYLVAGRFEEEWVLDETIDYVFTLKMRPTAVRLRMLKDERAGRQYLAVMTR